MDSDISLATHDFQRLAAFIEGTSGIRMPSSKKTMVEGRLRRRLKALKIKTLDEYCRFVFDHGGLATEATHLIDAVTTNKTDFFREPGHFQFLSKTLLPQLVGTERRGIDTPFTIWSAASSIGAEPYSLAMLLADFGRSEPRFQFSVLATDICTDVLRRAAKAIFPEEMIGPVPLDMRQRYLLRSRDRERQVVRIAPAIRQHVWFSHLNLMDTAYPMPRDLDVIFCRNILIYFDKPTQTTVLRRLCEHLRPGGHLFIGHSETVAGMDLPLRAVTTSIFQCER